jgi:Mn-containing catalase
MFLRSEKLLIPLQKPKNPDPNGAAAVQELLGGKFGEMSTLNNYLHHHSALKKRSALSLSMILSPALLRKSSAMWN